MSNVVSLKNKKIHFRMLSATKLLSTLRVNKNIYGSFILVLNHMVQVLIRELPRGTILMSICSILRGMDTLGKLLVIFYKVDNFCDFVVALLNQTLLKRCK